MSIKKILKDNLPPFMLAPLKRVYSDAHYAAMHVVPEEWYLKRQFKKRVGYSLNLDNPRTFNEKLQWLKLYDRNPLYTKMVDKYEAKKYAADIIGEEYIIPTLGVWDHFDEIDFDQLPGQFVLKCTHDSGSIVICKDKDKLDRKRAKEKLERGLRYNYYYRGGFEWPYKNVKPRIIAEKYMVDESRTELKDYKVFNFNGEPKIIQVDYDRFVEHKRNLYTVDWKYIEAAIEFATDAGHQIPRPKRLDEMLNLASKLAADIPHVRTDFYSIEDKIYFGEMTFFHGSGFEKFIPEEFGAKLGNCVNIQGGVILSGNGYILIVRATESCTDLTDYKFMCFNGKMKCSFTCTGRNTDRGLYVTFYDRDWKKLPFSRHYPAEQIAMPKPVSYEKMVDLAEKISAPLKFSRIDFYEISGKIYFGEITFFPGNGMEEFSPEEWDYKIGSWIRL